MFDKYTSQEMNITINRFLQFNTSESIFELILKCTRFIEGQ